MKAIEFRLGNFFQPTDGSNTEYKAVEADDLVAWEKGAIYGRTIPITEEWLLNFGFLKGSNWVTFLSPSELSSEGFFDKLCYDIQNSKFIVTSNEYDSFEIDCEFVHELQNIYFTLLREELTLKES